MSSNVLDHEIVGAFQEESAQLLKELESVVEHLEGPMDRFPTQELESFAQKIDRIMGTAKVLLMDAPEHQGLCRVSGVAELCKKLGYEASKVTEMAYLPLFAAFWADTLEVLDELIKTVENETENAEVAGSFAKILEGRLQWLFSKIKKDDSKKSLDNLGVDDLLKDLGF